MIAGYGKLHTVYKQKRSGNAGVMGPRFGGFDSRMSNSYERISAPVIRRNDPRSTTGSCSGITCDMTNKAETVR